MGTPAFDLGPACRACGHAMCDHPDLVFAGVVPLSLRDPNSSRGRVLAGGASRAVGSFVHPVARDHHGQPNTVSGAHHHAC